MAWFRPTRRWLVFTTRALMFLTLLVAILLGMWVNGARNQQAVVAAIRAFDSNANIWYRNEYFSNPSNASAGLGVLKATKPWWLHATVERQLGRDYFHGINSVAFGEGPAAPGTVRSGSITAELARLTNLNQAALYFELEDEDVTPLAEIAGLEIVILGRESPKLTDAALASLSRNSSINFLEIRGAPFTDAGIALLAGLKELEFLALGRAEPFSDTHSLLKVTGTGFAKLADLDGFARLEIDSPILDGNGLRSIGALPHLKHLKIKSGLVVDEDFRLLTNLVNLESLELTGSNFDGTGFRYLKSLPKLSSVMVAGENVNDEAIPHLASLSSLESLMIYRSKVTAAGLQGLRSSSNLKQMGLIPAVPGDTRALKQALPNCNILNAGRSL